MRIARWSVNATDSYDGDRFFTPVDGVKVSLSPALCLPSATVPKLVARSASAGW